MVPDRARRGQHDKIGAGQKVKNRALLASGMQTSLPHASGGRFPCGLETTTGYPRPTLRVGLANRKAWEDLTPARTGAR